MRNGTPLAAKQPIDLTVTLNLPMYPKVVVRNGTPLAAKQPIDLGEAPPAVLIDAIATFLAQVKMPPTQPLHTHTLIHPTHTHTHTHPPHSLTPHPFRLFV